MTTNRLGSYVFALAIGAGVAAPAPLPKGKEPTTPFVKWAAKEEFARNDPHDPLVVKGLVIVGTDKGELRAYGCKDGKLAWCHEHGQRIFHAPASDGERVFFTSQQGLTAVAAKDGAKVWSFERRACDGPTLALAKLGLVYVGGHDGQLYALDAKTGKQRWASDFLADAPPDRPGFPGERARLATTKARPSELTSDGEALYLSVFDQSRVVAVSAKAGKRLWALQAGGWVYGGAVATAKHVYFGSYDKFVHCLDKKTGKPVWKYKTNGRIASGGALDGTNVYIASCDGNLYCLGQSDGKKRWHFPTDPSPGGRPSAIYSTPVLRGGTLHFAAGEGQLYAVDRGTGKRKWKIRPSKGSEMYCSPATDGALTFVVTRAAGRSEGEPSLVAVGVK